MRHTWWLAAMAGAVALAAGAGADNVAADELKVGDLAPAFRLKGSDGQVHSLEEHRGERVVVLAWFPKAFTGG